MSGAPDVGLEAGLARRRFAVPVAPEGPMESIVRLVSAAPLDRQLDECGADLGQERAGLVDGVGGVVVHRSRRW